MESSSTQTLENPTTASNTLARERQTVIETDSDFVEDGSSKQIQQV